MQPYLSYKDSGVIWIGKIPNHWYRVKFKYLTDLLTCGHAATPEYVDEEFGMPFLSAQNIKNEKVSLHKFKYIPFDLYSKLTKNHKVEDGDLIQVRVGGEDTIGQTAIVDISMDFAIYVSLSHIKPSSRAFNHYIKHLCNSTEFKSFCGVIMKRGAGVANLNVSDLEMIKVPLPPLSEQKSIAEYLNYKTTQIDQTITDKERLLKLYEEEKKAIINHAVTKGLDPSVQLKDSGVEWLGEIPEYWGAKKLKFVANCSPSSIDKKSKEDETEVYLCNYMDVYNNDFIDDNYNFMLATASSEQIKKFRLKEGDVIVTKDSEAVDDIAVPVLVRRDFDDVVCGYHLTHITPDKQEITGEYLFNLFRAKSFNMYFETSARGITRYGLSVPAFNDAYVPLPEIEEQEKINEYISEKLNKINSESTLILKEIELLKEFKQSLIFEAVTGKIDVR
ncbi:restriction endonuclease subunit S [Aureitalea sp. L0-47]|uniref:restriction endonuclease subunit S n=1 Tax=Aureitalea sp. L0-47 TaxID=2816962 RepID=UPI002238D474|nr:restriction endonuclease subunit S [Aureitalea sp. L0-47]MCW5518496.1 restriction endonuclease subunit S [Aureitalea sp. L0-47]